MNRIRKAGGRSRSGRRGGSGDEVAGGDEVWPPGGPGLRVVGGGAEVAPIPGPIRVTVDPRGHAVEILLTCLTADQWKALSMGEDPGGYHLHAQTGLYVRLEERAIFD